MRNVEAKIELPAGVNSSVLLKQKNEKNYDVNILRQVDTFFAAGGDQTCDGGNYLKLRELTEYDVFGNLKGSSIELIRYSRATEGAARVSTYDIFSAANPTEAQTASLKTILQFACVGSTASGTGSDNTSPAILGIVDKKRTVCVFSTHGQKMHTRIHYDEVKGLAAHYLEIEVVLADDEDEAFGREVLNSVLARLHLQHAKVLSVPYLALLLLERAIPVKRGVKRDNKK